MSQHVLPAVPSLDATTDFALISYLASYLGATLRAHQQDLKAYLRWCGDRQLPPLQVKRSHLALYLRWLEDHRCAPATIGRRFTTVAGFYRYAVLDGQLHVDPSVPSADPRWRGRHNAGPCCTRRSSPRCSPPPASTAPAVPRWWRCSA